MAWVEGKWTDLWTPKLQVTADDIRPIVTNSRAVRDKPTKEKR